MQHSHYRLCLRDISYIMQWARRLTCAYCHDEMVKESLALLQDKSNVEGEIEVAHPLLALPFCFASPDVLGTVFIINYVP